MADYKSVRYDGAIAAGVTGTAQVYANANALPLTGLTSGEMAFTNSNTLYITNGSGWYQIAVVNETPTITLNTGTVSFRGDAANNTITYTINEPEGTPTGAVTITYGFEANANVTHDSANNQLTVFNTGTSNSYSGIITISVSDGENIGTASISVENIPVVINSNHTTFLLKTSGNDVNNSSSGAVEAITGGTWSSGTPRAQSFSPFHPGGYSTYFDGTDDKLYIDNNSSFEVGSNDFTLEFWYYPQTSNSNEAMAGYYSTTSNQRSYAVYHADTSANLAMVFSTNGSYQSENVTVSSVTPEQMNNKWNHIALTKSGTTAKLWHNGILVATDTSAPTTLYAPTSGPFNIGTFNETDYIQGYLRDVRLVVGSQVYTSSFTPPSATLTAISGTQLLACASGAPLDLSTNNHYVKYTSDPQMHRFGPYDTNEYNPASYDSGYTGGILTWNGDYRPTGDFTVEGWVWNKNTSANLTWVRWGDESSNRYVIFWRGGSEGRFRVDKYGDYYADIGTTGVNDGSEMGIYKWTHVAVVRYNNVITLYINGRSKGTHTRSGTLGNAAKLDLTSFSTSGADYIVADIRYSNGTARYTGTFSPPTGPVGTDSDTTVYVRARSPKIYDASGSTRVVTDGSIVSSTSQAKHSSSSLYIPNDDLFSALAAGSDSSGSANPGNLFEDEAATIEWWVRTGSSTFPDGDAFMSNGWYSGGYSTWLLYTNSNSLVFYAGTGSSWNIFSAQATGLTFSANTWHHMAITKNDGVYTFFRDGTQTGQLTTTTAIPSGGGSLYVGAGSDSTRGFPSSYYEDIRVSKNLSRYPFIPFQNTLSNDSNTDFLTGHADTIVDGSSNSYTITSNGPAVTNFGPFTGMKSIYFDGSNDTMTVPAAAWDRDADYTVECWMYPTGAHYVAMSRNRQHADGIIFSISSNGIVFLGVGRDNVDSWDLNYTGSEDIRNRWNHLALTHDASEKRYRIFVNGTQVFTGISAYHPGSLSSDFDIGCAETMNSASNTYGIGWISNHRISNNIRYTTSFTPPTARLYG